MKISSLISRLEAALEEAGDVEVEVATGHNRYVPLVGIPTDTTRDEIVIIATDPAL